MENTVYRFNKDLIWSLPCLFQYDAVFNAAQKIAKHLGFEYFNADVYGAPASLWSGGRRPILYEKFNSKTLDNLFNYIKKYNGNPVLTFNCSKITKEDLNDEYANLLLEKSFEHNAKYIVYSDILKDYIKSKKSDAIVISSVIKPVFYYQGPDKIEEPNIESETKYYNKLLKEYDFVTVRPEYSKFVLTQNPDLIDDLSRIQVIVNQSCLCNCNNAKNHIEFNEKYRLENDSENIEFLCPRINLSYAIKYRNNSMHTFEEIQALYDSGVRHFKLKGRGGNREPVDILAVICSWIYRWDGPNYYIAQTINEEYLEGEIKYFSDFINQK